MRRYQLLIVAVIIVVLGIGVVAATDLFRSISTNLRAYNNVVKHLLSEYVDEIDSDELISSSIRGMLDDLDPYTVFIREEDQSAVGMLTRGKYGGVGIRLAVRGDTLTVIAPIEGTPAYRAGVRAGDKIIKIDNVSSLDFRTDEAARKIRGKPGTKVTLTFRRYGEKDPLDITMVREEIEVNDMPYYGVDDGIGYIRITRFSRDTAQGFRKAVKELQGQGINGLVVDLRDNPGGLLQDAVVMVDALVEPGLLIVETRGRTKKMTREYYSENEPVLDSATPLVILVNQGSASASEIVAGAVQDLDRGIIVGDRTFGKGLVQSIFQVGKNTSLKLTTAKYYIPSGRLIQKEDYLDNGVLTDGLDKRDSLFVTRSGRIVHGGGGIIPDTELDSPSLTPLATRLWSKSLFFAFATRHQNKYDLSLPVVISDGIMEDFRRFMEAETVEVIFPGERDLESFEANLEKLESFNGKVDLSELKSYYQAKKATAFDDEYEQISRRLRVEFAGILGGLGERIHSGLEDDPGYQRAVEVLQSPLAYQRILQPDGQTAHNK
ncbi:MAG: S41 family peptidase [Fidelibacterota bacterium]|nr:MAG: S41 family peptidase [Candidatus Neomarinimicrobiota bacterium]